MSEARRATVREATRDDMDALAGLLAELFSVEADFEFDEPRVRRGLGAMLDGGDGRRVWVAEADGLVVGMCSVQVVTSTAEGGEAALLEDLVVLPEYRREGVAALLVETAESWARGRGIRRMQLLADHTNAPALGFYSGAGWARTRLVCLRRML